MEPVILTVAHVPQESEGQCVAACASMCLAHIGLPTAYETVMNVLRTQSFGTPSFNVRNLEKLGVTVIYKQGSFDELYEHLSNERPCIAFVKTGNLPYWDDNLAHAVVVSGLDDDYVYLNDPVLPYAPAQVARGDFDLAWLDWDELYAVLRRNE